MLSQIVNLFLYAAIAVTLFLVDYGLGNGLLHNFQGFGCRLMCWMKKYVKENGANNQVKIIENPVKLPILLLEIFALTFTIVGSILKGSNRNPVTNPFPCVYVLRMSRYSQQRILRRYKNGIFETDRIDQLLQESRDTIQRTNDYLEKWRLRRIYCKVPPECSYLDDESQEIRPLTLEVPILHMAIIDSRGTARNQERGDAGDTVFTESTVLSITSLVDEIEDTLGHVSDENTKEETDNIGVQSRYLWDLVEEDSSTVVE